jgi:hypothetical protein
MVVSELTAEKIYQVVRKHVSERQMSYILKDLMEVPGNVSFRETVVKLMNIDALHRTNKRSVVEKD